VPRLTPAHQRLLLTRLDAELQRAKQKSAMADCALETAKKGARAANELVKKLISRMEEIEAS